VRKTVTAPIAHYQALMLDHAAGSLNPSQRLLVETHLRLRPEARCRAGWLDAAGGAMLECLEPHPVASRPLPVRDHAPSQKERHDDDLASSRALIEAALRRPEGLGWRWRAPALRELKLPLAGASLVRMAGGRAVPAHDHAGEELTLVLSGAYADESGVYREGEIAFADAGVEHSPYVPEGGECVCLLASGHPLRFRGLIARLAYRLLS
jgi:putative transcriptional regulator